MGWHKSSQIVGKQKNVVGFIPESSMDGAKLPRCAVAKPYFFAISSSASSSALLLYHDFLPVAILSRLGSVHATEPSPKVPPVAHKVPPGPHSRNGNSCSKKGTSSHPGGYYCNYSGCLLLQDSGLPLRRVYVCVFIKLHITAQSGLVILVILCHSH